jgi:NAD(P)-dependent dehydrogenase (short-subunit alcohol dehydrogenase family)
MDSPVVLITRALTGIGRATALAFAEEGAQIVISGPLEAAEFGVRVNAASPGPIETGMLDRFAGSAERKAGMTAAVPFKRLGKPEEIAQMIVFVASDKASFSTGATFCADGGKAAL